MRCQSAPTMIRLRAGSFGYQTLSCLSKQTLDNVTQNSTMVSGQNTRRSLS